MATGLCNHHRGTILPGFPPQAFPRLSSADHWVDNADRSPTKGNLEPSWNSELIACRNQRVGAQIDGTGELAATFHTTYRWVPKSVLWTQRRPFCGAGSRCPQDNIGTSEDFFPCRNGSNKGFSITTTIEETRPAIVIYRASLIPQSLDAVLLSQDADLKGHIIALDIRR